MTTSPLTAHRSPVTGHGSLPASLVTARRTSRHALWVATGRPGALAAVYLIEFAAAARGVTIDDPWGVGVSRSRTPLDRAWQWALAHLSEDMRQVTTRTFGMIAPFTWLVEDELI